MECNKDEAVRAKEIAEKRMQNKDFVGAQKLVLKARKLYPALENISQMLTVCEVHVAAGINVVGSEADWYGILQSPQSADESYIKKQYRKLALMLHPDKNKFPGAEAAFKLIGEAHMVLSNQEKRSQYDTRRQPSVCTSRQKQPSAQTNKSSDAKKSSGMSQPNRPKTQTSIVFWTKCSSCNTMYQHYRTLLNRSIRCQHCLHTFVASDISAQGGANQAGRQSKDMKNRGANQAGQQSNHRSQGKASNDGDAYGLGVKSRKEDVETNRTAQREESLSNKKRERDATMKCGKRFDGEDMDVKGDAIPKDHATTRNRRGSNDYAVPRKSKKLNRGSSSDGTDNQSCPFSNADAENRSAKLNEGPHDEQRLPNGELLPKIFNRYGECVEENTGEERFSFKKGMDCAEESCKPEVKSQDTAKTSGESNPDHQIVYPEPDFYDFDKDRTQDHFKVDQLWTVYDDADGMPRYYARIRKVYSNESRVKITWLEADPQDQVGIHWLIKKLPMACGNFRTGDTQDTEDLLMFSHLALWQKGKAKGAYKIYPNAGDVWALFKCWSIQWSSIPDARREYEFEFVEVLCDYSEETGVLVKHLVKLDGFTSLFRSTNNMVTIPPEELLRFSHKVPCFRLTGEEREDVPRSSFELDPASVFSGGLPPSEDADRVFNESMNVESNALHNERLHTPYTSNSSRLTERNTLNNEKLANGENQPGRLNASHPGKNANLSFSGSRTLDGKHDKICIEEILNGCGLNKEDNLDTISNHCDGSGQISTHDLLVDRFESERSVDKFQVGQIWSLYSSQDGSLPKYYARIKKVTLPKFKVLATWLVANPHSEKEMWWSKKELPITCGAFKLRSEETEVFESPGLFSHRVKHKSTKEGYFIFPKKGEVWALYKNWSADWAYTDLMSCEYELVQVNTDDWPIKVSVVLEYTPKIIYRDSGVKKVIARDELLRFSHLVPSYRLTKASWKDYLVLDPKAVP